MKWIVQGADRSTGRDMTIYVEASDAEGARAQGYYNDLLVEKVTKAKVETVAEPSDTAVAPATKWSGPSRRFVFYSAAWLVAMVCLGIILSGREGQLPAGAAPEATETASPKQLPRLDPEAIFSTASPAVVKVFSYGPNDQSQGSGFFVSPLGYVITNFHVIESGTNLFVKDVEGNRLPVIDVRVDPDVDLAILFVGRDRRYPFLRLASDAPHVGSQAFAIGSPMGLENTMSRGLVSGVRRVGNVVMAIQTDAPISHGSSGGPLLDESGCVVGVTTFQLTDGQNLNFAIPSFRVSRLMDRYFPGWSPH